MKTSQDPRHLKRQKLVQSLFAWDFKGDQQVGNSVKEIINNQEQIDELVGQAAPAWPLPQIAKADLAILRLAVFELLIEKKQPPKVIVDEAVELAKEFGSRTSPGFINGVLGTIIKNDQLEA